MEILTPTTQPAGGGEADTAIKLSSARTFALTGDVTGTVDSDLENGASIAAAIGSGVIHASGSLNFDNPVQTVLAGPVGTGTGWPSAARAP